MDYIIKFKKAYTWEGKEYTELDLSGLDNLKIKDAIEIQSELFDEQETASALLSETTTSFARKLACRATGMPIEFFKLMPIPITRQVTAKIQEYLGAAGREEVKGNIYKLQKTYLYKDKTYEKIDVSGLSELNSMNLSAAENRIAAEGFLITATQFNYLFAMVMLSQATGLDEEFFKGLPISELLGLKGVANNSDFFE
ncbi:MAG: phage tail assembly protein [Eubacteriales bacterium]|nr:phage tail assembly protein [Eubacteriales bacterium]